MKIPNSTVLHFLAFETSHILKVENFKRKGDLLLLWVATLLESAESGEAKADFLDLWRSAAQQSEENGTVVDNVVGVAAGNRCWRSGASSRQSVQQLDTDAENEKCENAQYYLESSCNRLGEPCLSPIV